MNKPKIFISMLVFACLAGSVLWLAATSMADHDHKFKRHFERDDHHGIRFLKGEDEGNETAGQIAAWLLLVANLPVGLSLLVKGANRFTPLNAELKSALKNFNRVQKKALMPIHYYLNLAILGIVSWHWVTSWCKSTALPEIGFSVMVGLAVLGMLMKFNLCPKAFRKYVYKIHTQPVFFLSLVLVLTAGHLIID
jgi:hypothetical protein